MKIMPRPPSGGRHCYCTFRQSVNVSQNFVLIHPPKRLIIETRNVVHCIIVIWRDAYCRGGRIQFFFKLRWVQVVRRMWNRLYFMGFSSNVVQPPDGWKIAQAAINNKINKSNMVYGIGYTSCTYIYVCLMMCLMLVHVPSFEALSTLGKGKTFFCW